MDNFADDVAWWITLNEPLTIVENGYAGAGPTRRAAAATATRASRATTSRSL